MVLSRLISLEYLILISTQQFLFKEEVQQPQPVEDAQAGDRVDRGDEEENTSERSSKRMSIR